MSQPYLLLHFPPPPLLGTLYQQWLAQVFASVLPEPLRSEMVLALLTATPTSPVAPYFDLVDLEDALASGTLERADLDTLCRYLATEVALARQCVAAWVNPPTWYQRLWRNGVVGRHAARIRRLWAALLAHSQEQPLARFRQALAGSTRQA